MTACSWQRKRFVVRMDRKKGNDQAGAIFTVAYHDIACEPHVQDRRTNSIIPVIIFLPLCLLRSDSDICAPCRRKT